MRKIFCVILGLVLVETPCFAQISKQPAQTLVKEVAKLAKKTGKHVPNISSKQLKAKLKLSILSSQMAQNAHQQKAMAIMLAQEADAAQKVALLKQLNEQDAPVLQEWTQTVTTDRLRWATALVRERNAKFLPPKDKDIPGLIAFSPLEDAPDLLPGFFREWARLIQLYPATPEQYQGLILGLRQQLIRLDVRYREWEEKALKSQKMLTAAGKPEPEIYFVSQLDKLSRESAQCVSDLVDLLNLYPSLYNQSLNLLAAKLDALPYTSKFLEYIRPQILIPNQVKAAAAAAEESAPVESSHKVVRGFAQYQDQPAPSTASQEPASSGKGRPVVKGFSIEKK